MRQEKREHSLVGKCGLTFWAIDMFIQQSRMEFSYLGSDNLLDAAVKFDNLYRQFAVALPDALEQ